MQAWTAIRRSLTSMEDLFAEMCEAANKVNASAFLGSPMKSALLSLRRVLQSQCQAHLRRTSLRGAQMLKLYPKTDAEIEVDADVFYDLFLTFDFSNRGIQAKDQTERFARQLIPFRFLYTVFVHIIGTLCYEVGCLCCLLISVCTLHLTG